MRLALLAVAMACVSPPASPELCRAEIAVPYARFELDWLVQITHEFAARSEAMPPEDRRDWRWLVGGNITANEAMRERTIRRCVADGWPTNAVRCYGAADSWEAIDECERRYRLY